MAYALAVLVGVTYFTNSVQGGTAVFGVLLATYGLSLVLLLGYGIWQRGFPEFTAPGWV